MQSGTPQTARETIAAELRRNHLTGCGAQYFDVLIAGYDAELESFARSVSNLKADLARLATQKAESLPDGSREFSAAAARWRVKLELDGIPRLYILTEDGTPQGMPLHDASAPHFHVLGREFAALGREQGRAEAMREKVNILPGAKAIIEWKDARIAELEAQLAASSIHTLSDPMGCRREIYFENGGVRWKVELEADYETPPTLHRSLGGGHWRMEDMDHEEAPPAVLLAVHFAALGREQGRSESERRIDELEQTERDSRAEVASLVEAMDQQKERAEMAEAATQSVMRIMGTINEERNDFCRQLAALEGDGRTEGADVEMAAVYDGGNGGGYEPHVRLYVRRGDRIYILAEDRGRYDRQTGAELSPPNREWVKLPPLPPIEPVKAGAEECEPDPPGMVRHDWRKVRPGLIACERCGKLYRAGIKNEACGAQP